MDWRDHIHSDPGIGQGKPVFRGTRYKVEFLLGLMGAGWDHERIVAEYPEIKPEFLWAAAAFAAEIMHDEDYIAIGKARAAWKFLLDVHVPLSLTRALIEDKHDVVRAAAAHAHWSDARLLAMAVADRFVIVTEDSDFSELVFGKGHDAPPSIFYLQTTQIELPELIKQVRLVIETDRFANHMVVIRRSTIRYRAFPGKQKNG